MRLSSRWSNALQIAASLALLALAIAIARPSHLADALKNARPAYLLFSLLFVPFLIALRVIRWHVLTRSRKTDMALRDSFHSYMGGLTLAIITPFAAGEIARGAIAAPDDRASFMGLTFLDKIIDAVTLFLFACAGFAMITTGLLRVAGVAVAVAGVASLTLARRVTAFLERRLPDSRMANALRRASLAARSVPPRVFAGCFLVATLNLALYYLHLYIIMYGFSPAIRPEAVGLFPLITLSRIIPSVAGLGVREFTAGALFANARYEVTSAAAVEASLMQFVTVNIIPVAIWIAAAGGLRRLAAAAKKNGDKGDQPR